MKSFLDALLMALLIFSRKHYCDGHNISRKLEADINIPGLDYLDYFLESTKRKVFPSTKWKEQRDKVSSYTFLSHLGIILVQLIIDTKDV